MRLWTAGTLLTAIVALGSCSSGGSEEFAVACPNAYRVQEASGLVKFRAGPGRDPTDVLFRAEIGGIDVECRFNSRRGYVDVDLKVQILVAQGPSTGDNRAAFEYAVGLLGPTGTPLQRQRFSSEVAFAAGRNRGTVTDEVTVRVPMAQGIDPGGYRIAVGLVLTPEELEYNRRAAGTAPSR